MTLPDSALASVAWLESFINFEKAPAKAPYGRREYTLAPFREFLAAVGNPQDACPTIHIAGTKGKGSCALLIDRLARAAGLRTGRFTSPHLESYRERIALDGEPITPETFEETFLGLKNRCEALGFAQDKEFRSLFELTCAGAWLLFRDRGVDLVVLETGLGGRLDATNCVREPRAALVSSIGLDHTDLLGDTLEAIAREKAGIFKRGCPAVVRRQDRPEGDAIVSAMREVAEAAGVSSFEVTGERWRVEPAGGPGRIRVSREWTLLGEWAFGLPGEHQRGNLEACLAAFEASGLGPKSSAEWGALLERADLGAVRHPGRLEVVSERPLVVADGAHCPLSIRATLAALPEAFPGVGRWTVALGVLRTKRVEEMLSLLAEAPAVEAIVPVGVDDPRSLDRERLAEFVAALAPGKARPSATLSETIRERLASDPGENLGLLAAGTLFNIRAAREAARIR